MDEKIGTEKSWQAERARERQWAAESTRSCLRSYAVAPRNERR